MIKFKYRKNGARKYISDYILKRRCVFLHVCHPSFPIFKYYITSRWKENKHRREHKSSPAIKSGRLLGLSDDDSLIRIIFVGNGMKKLDSSSVRNYWRLFEGRISEKFSLIVSTLPAVRGLKFFVSFSNSIISELRVQLI